MAADNPLRLPPGVHVLERGWLSSNNILLLGRDEHVLIDSGYVTHAAQTLMLVEHVLHAHAARCPGAPRQLGRIINTHLHADHCGGNAALHGHYGCGISVPAAQWETVANWDEAALSFRATGQQCPRFAADSRVHDGDILPLGELSWQALAAPGHDPHALLLYCAQDGLLISADALWQHGFGVVFPELAGESGFAEVRATLDLIASLDVRVVIPGHGAPFTDVDAALQRAWSRLDYLQADPLRNAQNSVKVLLKFLLLERQSIALSAVPLMMRDIPMLALCNQRYFQCDADALAEWAMAQLIKAGAAVRADGYLHNAG